MISYSDNLGLESLYKHFSELRVCNLVTLVTVEFLNNDGTYNGDVSLENDGTNGEIENPFQISRKLNNFVFKSDSAINIGYDPSCHIQFM